MPAEIDARECEEFVLCEMAELTGQPGVRLDDNFLALGGDSLRAILLASAVEERYGVVIDVVDVFESASLRDLGRLVATTAAGAVPGSTGA